MRVEPRGVVLEAVPDVAVRWAPELGRTPAMYSVWPPTIWLNSLRWWIASLVERRVVLLHEVGHHLTLAVYRPGDSFAARCQQQWAEARAERAALRWWVDDAAVERAVEAGCCWPSEFAEHWGVTPEWAQQRLQL